MRKSLVLVGICAFLAATTRHSSSTISTLSAAAGPTAIGAAQKPPNESNLSARISRIENGLLPPFTIRGQPGPATIGDRMKKHNVPGVSIAFFDHGQILWTRTYGYADVARSGEPVRGGWRTYPEMAAAGLWTTPSDLARLAIEVQNEYAGKSSKVLSQQMMREMLTHQKGGSGLGFGLEAPGHKLRFAHNGWSEGFQMRFGSLYRIRPRHCYYDQLR
jgi:CubicO group peptidase (beta-lactamase class C family)